MIAHFYIIAESFQHNGQFSNIEIEEKVKRLSEDIALINQFKDTNKLYANFVATYQQIFYSTFTVFDFLCDPLYVKKFVDRDVINALQKIFEKANDTNYTTQEVSEVLINWNEGENCHGLIAFNKVNDIDDFFQLIYGIDQWYKFRRHFLGLYPVNEHFFIEECKKYFPKLHFHEDNKVTIKPILKDFSQNIIKHLGYLNDIFYNYRNKIFDNETVKYKTFTSECNLEARAAPKDNNDAKEKLSFNFLDDNGMRMNVICYPHLRLRKSDNVGDTHYYKHRIYFHEGLNSICKGNILIGHIGEHL